MRYGGNSSVLVGGRCPRCKQSVDKHRPLGGNTPFVGIDATREAEKLVNSLGEALDKSEIKQIIDHMHNPLREATMLGAALATIGGMVHKYVTISGAVRMDILNHIDNGKLAKGVIKVTSPNAFGNCLDKLPSCPEAVFRNSAVGKHFKPEPLSMEASAYPSYAVGACAAQKLLSRIFQDAMGDNRKITSLEMAEMMWINPGSKDARSAWSTREVVESCNTCKFILPQMLCTTLE